MPTDQYSFWELASHELQSISLDLSQPDPHRWLGLSTQSTVCQTYIFWNREITCAQLKLQEPCRLLCGAFSTS